MNLVRTKGELNEEATRYLQNFPEEMIFHTSNLHLLDSVGQGNKIFAAYHHVLKFLLGGTY